MRFEPWQLGLPGVGYLFRSPLTERLELEIVLAVPDLNPIGLLMYVARKHELAPDEIDRLLGCIVIERDGTFMIPTQLIGNQNDRELATQVEWVDSRLRWKGRG
jgi:hypothetical protein